MKNYIIKKRELVELCVMFSWCRKCNYVDIFPNTDYGCPKCNTPGSSPMFFSSEIFSLLQLIEDFYFAENDPIDSKDDFVNNEINRNDLAIIIFFCSFVETLIDHFLMVLMNKMQLPNKVQERLLDDNLSSKQRIEKLFRSLTNIKWKTALNKLNKDYKQFDFVGTVNFYINSVKPLRNRLLHRGDKWSISKETSEKCVNYTKQFLYLFVALNNKYVANS